jgi:signal transduction histidine kinase
LTNQAASALENARLYGELAEREKRLQELVGKIMVAQEEERRRVAYEVHDGLAQVAAAAHQHLQAFAHYHPPPSEEGREDLKHVSELVRQTVGEARRIIADLRPTALDDFGLRSAIRLHLDALRADGWSIDYEDGLDDERLPAATETAIFRVVQEALNNVGKHAGTSAWISPFRNVRPPPWLATGVAGSG